MSVMTATPGVTVRLRQVRALAIPACRALNWQPLAGTMVVGIGAIASSGRSDAMSRVTIASAAIALCTAFTLDDSAAVLTATSRDPGRR